MHTITQPTPIAVATPIPSSAVIGQAVIVTTGTAVQLPSNALVNNVKLKAKSTNNAAGVMLGTTSALTNTHDGTGNGYPLAPGEAMSFAVSNTAVLWFNGTAGDVISFGGN